MNKKLEASLIYAFAYCVAISSAVYSYIYWFKSEHLLTNLFLADLTASAVIYLGCICLNSFSLYDPYWSLQGNVISLFYFIQHRSNSPLDARSILVFILVNVWSIRLNSNLFLNGVDDKNFEDWRYSDFRKKSSPFIGWLLGLVTFILLPTFLVFFGLLPLYYVNESKVDLNYMDLIGLAVTLIGIVFEAIGDHELRMAHKKKIKLMDKGLWSLCRHPNYFGEISFWFGLLAFGYSAAGDNYSHLLLIGPVGIFLIIYFGSLPMMEERQLKNKKRLYQDYIKRVPFKLLPINVFNYKKFK
jgi:steroid 5-alpha reductase family enzyme